MPYPRSAETPRSGPRAAKTGREIQAAFVRLVPEKGFDAVSIADICREAEVNRTTFYLHFGDKYELLARSLVDLLVIPEHLVEQHAELPLAESILGLMKFVAENCLRYRAFFLSILEDGKYPAFYSLFAKNLEGGVAELVAMLNGRLKRQGKPLDESCVVFVSSAFFGSLMHWVKEGKPAELDAYCRSITKYALTAMGVPCPW
jgi:Transcriptional regulator